MGTLSLFLLVVLSPAVSTTSVSPSQLFPLVYDASLTLYTLTRGFQSCICYYDRNREIARALTVERTGHLRRQDLYSPPVIPDYQNSLNRYLRRCIAQHEDFMADATAGMEVPLYLPVYGVVKPLPPGLMGVSDDELKTMNDALIACMCNTMYDLNQQFYTIPEALVDILEHMQQCIDEFMKKVPKGALSNDQSTSAVPSLPASTTSGPGDLDDEKKNAIRPFSPASRKVVPLKVDNPPYRVPNIGAMVQRAGNDLQGAASKIGSRISSNTKVQKVLLWKDCMGRCMNEATLETLTGFLKDCMKRPRCGDLSQVLPQLNVNGLMQAAEKYRRDNQQRLQEIFEEHGIQIVVLFFLGALLLYVLGPGAWWIPLAGLLPRLVP